MKVFGINDLKNTEIHFYKEVLKKKNIIKKKKSETLKNIHSKRSIEEKQIYNEKISYAVKNSKKAKLQRIKRAKLGAMALQAVRNNLTEKELKIFNKKFGSKGVPEDQIKIWKKYYQLVWFYTNKNLKLVENINLRSKKFHLDHKFSIKEGFLQKISPKIIGSKFNLEIIPATENIKKGAKCSITKGALLDSFENSLNFGDF